MDNKLWIDGQRVITISDCLKPQEPMREVIKGIIPNASLIVIYGEAGLGKSWAVLDMAIAIANGEKWLGCEVSRGGVLYLDLEMGSRELMRRVSMVARGHGISSDIPFNAISLPDLNLYTRLKQDSDHLSELIQKYQPVVVFIDPLVDLCSGVDENSAQELHPPLLALKRVANDADVAIVLPHHPSKNGNYRGSSVIKGIADSLIKITGDQNYLTFKHEKKRHGESIDLYATKFFTDGMFNLSPANKIIDDKQTAGEEYVVRYLAEHGQSFIGAIQDSADVCSPATARKSVYSLAQKEIIRRVDGGGKGSRAEYALA